MSYVYFIKPIGEDGPIKIGFSSNPSARLAAINTTSPFRCEIVVRITALQEVEVLLHKRFADARLHGEWFAPVADLLELIENEKAITGAPEYFEEANQGWVGLCDKPEDDHWHPPTCEPSPLPSLGSPKG